MMDDHKSAAEPPLDCQVMRGEAPIDEAVMELKWALEQLDQTRSDLAYDNVMIEIRRIGRLADRLMPDDA